MAIALLVAFLVVPLAEIYVIVQVGEAIGAWQTVILLIVWSALGAWLVKHEGRRAWTAFRTAAESGRMPAREVADGALVLIGGVLLLTPGFITDAVGLVLVLPFTRPLARRGLLAFATRRSASRLRVRHVRIRRGPGSPYEPPPAGAPPWGSGPAEPGGRVIEGELLDRPDHRDGGEARPGDGH